MQAWIYSPEMLTEPASGAPLTTTGCAAQCMLEHLASLPVSLPVHVREIRPVEGLHGCHVVWIWPAFTATHTIWSRIWCRVEQRGQILSARALFDMRHSGLRLLLGPNPWSWRQMVAILAPAGIHCHMHRFAPFCTVLHRS